MKETKHYRFRYSGKVNRMHEGKKTVSRSNRGTVFCAAPGIASSLR